MRKVAVLLVLIMLISMPLSAQAATARSQPAWPEISFSGNTATCYVDIYGTAASDSLRATIKLTHDKTVVATWQATGTGYIHFSETAPATPGETYNLIVYLTINNTAYQPISCTKTYE